MIDITYERPNNPKEEGYLTSAFRKRGMNYYQYDPETKKIIEIELKKTNYGYNAEIDPTKPCVIAINMKNAIRKFGRDFDVSL